MKILYSNLRGFKSKVYSLSACIDEVNPTLICLVETHMDKEEQIERQGKKKDQNRSDTGEQE